MPETLKRLTLGLLLIAFAAGVLLYTDRKYIECFHANGLR